MASRHPKTVSRYQLLWREASLDDSRLRRYLAESCWVTRSYNNYTCFILTQQFSGKSFKRQGPSLNSDLNSFWRLNGFSSLCCARSWLSWRFLLCAYMIDCWSVGRVFDGILSCCSPAANGTARVLSIFMPYPIISPKVKMIIKHFLQPCFFWTGIRPEASQRRAEHAGRHHVWESSLQPIQPDAWSRMFIMPWGTSSWSKAIWPSHTWDRTLVLEYV